MRIPLYLILALSSFPCFAQLGKDLGEASQPRGANASDSQIIEALKDALTQSIQEAVQLAGQPDGFWANTSIKILLPPKMQAFEDGLRRAGQGLRIDEFELSMNRAAEMACAASGPMLLKGVAGLSFRDPRSVLNGNRSATTDFFKSAEYADLLKALRPNVEAAMAKTSVTRRYQYLAQQTKGLTLGEPFEFDITSYVVAETLEGILRMSGEEEAKIRANPEAQKQPAIRDVFKR